MRFISCFVFSTLWEMSQLGRSRCCLKKRFKSQLVLFWSKSSRKLHFFNSLNWMAIWRVTRLIATLIKSQKFRKLFQFMEASSASTLGLRFFFVKHFFLIKSQMFAFEGVEAENQPRLQRVKQTRNLIWSEFIKKRGWLNVNVHLFLVSFHYCHPHISAST